MPNKFTVTVSYENDPIVKGCKGHLGTTPVLQLNSTGKNFNGGIEGEYFDKFLKICFAHSTHFSLSKEIDNQFPSEPEAVETELSKFAVKSFNPKTWYGYPYGCREITIETIYTANEETLNILTSYYDDIFLSLRKGSTEEAPAKIGMLEDLCFWSDNKMLLGTLSHENMCSTNVISEDFARSLMEVGDWQVLDKDTFGMDSVK